MEEFIARSNSPASVGNQLKITKIALSRICMIDKLLQQKRITEIRASPKHTAGKRLGYLEWRQLVMFDVKFAFCISLTLSLKQSVLPSIVLPADLASTPWLQFFSSIKPFNWMGQLFKTD